jgi:hypothetical protein
VNHAEIVAQDVPSQNFTNRSGTCSVQYQFGECEAHYFTVVIGDILVHHKLEITREKLNSTQEK